MFLTVVGVVFVFVGGSIGWYGLRPLRVLPRILRSDVLDPSEISDESFVVCSGIANKSSETLLAPFSGSSCLGFEFEVTERQPFGIGIPWFQVHLDDGVATRPFTLDGPDGGVDIVPSTKRFGLDTESTVVTVGSREKPPERIQRFIDVRDDLRSVTRWIQVIPGLGTRRYIERRIDPGEEVLSIDNEKHSYLYTNPLKTKSVTKVAIYAQVSTNRQDPDRQVRELESFVEREYPDADLERYVDIISGTTEGGGEEYQRLRENIATDELGTVIVHKLSRLSRLGGGEIHDFIQHALKHDTSVRDLEVGLFLDVDDNVVDQAVTQMIANLMGDLARIEQKQKVRRIQSGIVSAQEVGKWTGRPPRGFTVKDGHLRVDTEEFLRVRSAIERVAAGDSAPEVADDTGLPESTLRELYRDRPELYLRADTDDDRFDTALNDVRPLDEPRAEPEALDDRIRNIVREEISGDSDE